MDLLSPHGGHTVDHPFKVTIGIPIWLLGKQAQGAGEEQVLPKATHKVKCQSQWGDRPDADQSLVARGRT